MRKETPRALYEFHSARLYRIYHRSRTTRLAILYFKAAGIYSPNSTHRKCNERVQVILTSPLSVVNGCDVLRDGDTRSAHCYRLASGIPVIASLSLQSFVAEFSTAIRCCCLAVAHGCVHAGSFCQKLASTVRCIPRLELSLNQTHVRLMPSSSWTWQH